MFSFVFAGWKSIVPAVRSLQSSVGTSARQDASGQQVVLRLSHHWRHLCKWRFSWHVHPSDAGPLLGRGGQDSAVWHQQWSEHGLQTAVSHGEPLSGAHSTLFCWTRTKGLPRCGAIHARGLRLVCHRGRGHVIQVHPQGGVSNRIIGLRTGLFLPGAGSGGGCCDADLSGDREVLAEVRIFTWWPRHFQRLHHHSHCPPDKCCTIVLQVRCGFLLSKNYLIHSWQCVFNALRTETFKRWMQTKLFPFPDWVGLRKSSRMICTSRFNP